MQLFFSIYFFSGLASHQQKSDSHDQVPLSVIVCARNEFENLQKLVPLIMSQNYSLFELIVINDRSNDDTEYYLKEIKDLYKDKLKVIVVEDTPPKMDPKKYAITLGIKAASYDNVVFTDADCYPTTKNWLMQMQTGFQLKKQINLGVSQYEEKKGFLNWFIRNESFYTAIQYLSFALKGIPYMGVGRNMAYNKRLFFENKGFHPFMDVTGGDDDLFINMVANSKNTHIEYSYDAQTISYPKTSWKEWYRQKTRHMAVGKLYKTKFKLLLGCLNISHILFYLFSIILICFDYTLYWVYGVIILRLLINWISFGIIIKKMRYKLSHWSIPAFDILYLFYYIAAGFNALRTKRIRWK
ncbi:MAG: glycosyltransferase [Bacteroidota bacterium]|nr:glycosyltransferase [Bacteroidota bacterium]